MKWNRNRYDHSWFDFVKAWLAILVGGPLGLMFIGFVLKLIWNCFMVGWSAV